MVDVDVISDISFSEYTPGDYGGFVACVNDFYKGGYPYGEYLEREFIEANINSGDMIVTVAKASDGRVVGTSAVLRLKGMFEGSAILLLRTVLSGFQRRGIGSKQEYFLFDLISQKFKDIISVYADVMTHDTASQSTLIRHGFTFCGLRMMLYKNEIICPKIAFESGTKMTQAIYCKAISKKPVEIFVPDEVKETVWDIYNDLGSEPVFKKVGEDNATTDFSLHTNERHSVTEIYVEYSGGGNLKELISSVERIINQGHTAVCYINMCQGGAEKIYSTLKQKGFFFTAVKPLSRSGEYLVMSNIDNCRINFDNIKYPPSKEAIIKKIFGGYTNEA